MRISDWSSDVCSSDLPMKVSQACSSSGVSTLSRAADSKCSTMCCCRRVQYIARPLLRARRCQRTRHSRTDRPRERSSTRRVTGVDDLLRGCARSEEHTSELQTLMRISYAVFCLKKKNKT